MAQNEPQRRDAARPFTKNHHYYLNISVEAANVSDWRIESNRKNRFGSENRIESKLFCPNWNAVPLNLYSLSFRLHGLHRFQRLYLSTSDSVVFFVLYFTLFYFGGFRVQQFKLTYASF